MATSLQLNVLLGLYGEYRDDGETLTDVDENIGVGLSTPYVNGTAANKADRWYRVQLALLANTPQNIDLFGSVTDVHGQTINLATLRVLVVRMVTTTSGLMCVITGNLLDGIQGGSSQQRTVKAGGIEFLNAPIDGHTVTNTSADTLTFNPGANAMTVDVYILGTTA